jgi:hypothetical protein
LLSKTKVKKINVLLLPFLSEFHPSSEISILHNAKEEQDKDIDIEAEDMYKDSVVAMVMVVVEVSAALVVVIVVVVVVVMASADDDYYYSDNAEYYYNLAVEVVSGMQ